MTTPRAGLLPLLLLMFAAACGKKGPPLPPLVRLPAPPADFTAVRQGARVALRLGVPKANTNGSTPADLSRVDVYALTGPDTLTPNEIIGKGQRVGSVAVNEPPDEEQEGANPPTEAPPKPRPGLDQGAVARFSEAVISPATAEDVRAYVAVGFNQRGRRGAFSARVLVPLGPAPAAPGALDVSYDERAITVRWDAPDAGDQMPGYNVYVPGDAETKLTPDVLGEPLFQDGRPIWGVERCYIVRAVERRGTLPVESEATPRACVTPKDTFPPVAPLGLKAIASPGAVSLIWDANREADVAGYLVSRAIADASLAVITPAPIEETTFTDTVASGVHVAYVVQAVDKAGNVSPMSERIEETAR